MRTAGEHFNGESLSEGLARASFEHALDAMLVASDERPYVPANPQAVVAAVVELADALGMTIVADGVET